MSSWKADEGSIQSLVKGLEQLDANYIVTLVIGVTSVTVTRSSSWLAHRAATISEYYFTTFTEHEPISYCCSSPST